MPEFWMRSLTNHQPCMLCSGQTSTSIVLGKGETQQASSLLPRWGSLPPRNAQIFWNNTLTWFLSSFWYNYPRVTTAFRTIEQYFTARRLHCHFSTNLLIENSVLRTAAYSRVQCSDHILGCQKLSSHLSAGVRMLLWMLPPPPHISLQTPPSL